jgi:hypothetical protein
MKNIISKSVLALILAISMFSCNPDEVQPLLSAYPLQETSLYPESFVYSNVTEKVYVGSYFKGKIITVDLLGNMADFITDDSFVAVVGMAIDEKNNRLLVCNSDAGISQRSGQSTVGQLAKVLVFDLTTGEKLNTIDLGNLFPGGHFLNDLVLDDAGNIYVTDSFSPVVYKINQNYKPSVFVTHPSFEVPPYAFGLNGIEYHPDNFLIVGRAFGGILYKIPLSNPDNVQEIPLNTSVNSLDGLLLTDNNTLALVSNNFTGEPFDETVYKIETSDNWSSASVTGAVKELAGTYPTSLSMINNGLFVNFGYFPELIDPGSPPNDDFKLQKITF